MIAELIINNVCNLSCAHCFHGKKELVRPELSLSAWADTIDKLAPYVDGFHFAGKEPLIGRDMFFLANYIKRVYPEKKISFVTNGVGIARYHAFIVEHKWDSVGVSISSPDIRPYNAVNSALYLHEMGVPITIYYSLSSSNCDKVLTSVWNLFSAGITRFWFIPILPFGCDPALSPSSVDLLGAIDTVYSAMPEAEFVFDIKHGYYEDIADSIKQYPEKHFYIETCCNTFQDTIVITPDGEVLGCGFEFDSIYPLRSVGNILLDSVEELLEAGKRKRNTARNYPIKCDKDKRGCTKCAGVCPVTRVCNMKE